MDITSMIKGMKDRKLNHKQHWETLGMDVWGPEMIYRCVAWLAPFPVTHSKSNLGVAVLYFCKYV